MIFVELNWNYLQYVKKTRDLEMSLMKASATNGPNNTHNTKADSPPTTSVNKSKVSHADFLLIMVYCQNVGRISVILVCVFFENIYV